MSETTSIYICQICKREFKNFIGLSFHIVRTHKITSKDYYDKFIKTENDGICIECGNETIYRGINQGYLKHCSYKCSNSSKTNLDKKNATMIDKYGFPYTGQVPELQDRMKATMTERYGFPYTMQVPEFMNRQIRSSIKRKSYIWPSGIEIFVQGNERKALDSLLLYFTEEEIIAGDINEIPAIPYFFNKKEHIYHPDIWIPSINTLVEIKSLWTMDEAYDALNYDRNIAKHNFSENAGYDHVFMILN